MYDEKNNKNRFKKSRSRVNVVKKQDENKNINNKEVENYLKVKKHEFDYYVVKESNYYITDLNVNFYDVEDYNQKKENNELNINFITIFMIHCHNCHQFFDLRNVLFQHLCSDTNKIICYLKRKTITSTSIVMLTKSLSKSSDKI